MNDYRIKITVRNNRILQAFEKNGVRFGEKWCLENGFSYTVIRNYINLVSSPLCKKGFMSETALKLCVALKETPNNLWSEEQLYPLDKNSAEVDVDFDLIESLLHQNKDEIKKIEDSELLEKLFKSQLDERETKIIKMLYFDELNHEDVGKEIGVQRERVRQIEAKALRKMRYVRSHSTHRDFLPENIETIE